MFLILHKQFSFCNRYLLVFWLYHLYRTCVCVFYWDVLCWILWRKIMVYVCVYQIVLLIIIDIWMHSGRNWSMELWYKLVAAPTWCCRAECIENDRTCIPPMVASKYCYKWRKINFTHSYTSTLCFLVLAVSLSWFLYILLSWNMLFDESLKFNEKKNA